VWSLELTAFWMMFLEGYMGEPPTICCGNSSHMGAGMLARLILNLICSASASLDREQLLCRQQSNRPAQTAVRGRSMRAAATAMAAPDPATPASQLAAPALASPWRPTAKIEASNSKTPSAPWAMKAPKTCV